MSSGAGTRKYRYSATSTMMADDNEARARNETIKGLSQDGSFVSSSSISAGAPESQRTKTAAIRHLEKRRPSTCRFADRVARVALNEYRQRVPREQQQPATCIAAILIHDQQEQDYDRQLQVVGLGVGTKFLTNETLDNETKHESYGRRVRDCHAEVLARRAFRRQILWMMHQDLQQNNKKEPSVVDSESGKATTTNGASCDEGRLFNFLHRVSVTPPTKDEEAPSQQKKQKLQQQQQQYRYALRPGVTLHMYSSTAPCGNATLKKFAKMEKERFIEHLGDNEWPTTPHEVISPHSWKLGQFSLLLKRDTRPNLLRPSDDSANSASTPSCSGDTANRLQTAASPRNKQKNVVCCYPLEITCPPGTCSVGNERGVVHTCSDKICRWNCLGLQGSLLSSLLKEPLYLSTLTVGRKLTACICRRAVCCRIGNDGDWMSWPNITQSQQAASPQQPSPFHLVHPAILGTCVYVDEDAAIDMSSSPTKDGVKGQDVRFHSSLSWAWWPGKEMECLDVEPDSKHRAMAECIDGTTGFVPALEQPGGAANAVEKDEPTDMDIPIVSRISTASLLQRYLEIQALFSQGKISVELQVSPSSTSPTSLPNLLLLKQQVAPGYEMAKEELLRQHPVLREWKRRNLRLKNIPEFQTSGDRN